MSEKRTIFLSGKIVNLRPAQKSDVPLFTRWINDPEVRQFLASIFPQTEKQEESWYENMGKDDHNIVLVIETKDGTPIGLMGIHKIHWINRTATTGALIGEPEYWGSGYGTDAKMILLDYAFNTLGLRKIESDVIAFNKRSLRYSLHCGYKIEGKVRKHIFRNGKFWDKIMLGVFHDEWLPIWKKYQKTDKIR